MSNHSCAKPEAAARLRRDGRPCDRQAVIATVGGPIAMGALGLPTVMANNESEFIGFRFLDSDDRHAVQVWLAWNDTFTIERCRDGAVLGRLEGIYAEDVAELAWQASCFRDTRFGSHDPTTKKAR